MNITTNTTINVSNEPEDIVLKISANLQVIVIETTLHPSVTIEVGENATVQYIYVYSGNGNTEKKVYLHPRATIQWRSAILGGNNRTEIITYHQDEGAVSDHRGIFLGKGRDRFVLNYWSNHAAQHTTGHILVHGVLFDSAYADFKGNIKIQQTGGDTNASLVEETILLGEKSRSDSIPQLEIATNDVRATHSSAISKIDDEQLFYLQSRGIAIEEGKRLIVRGFLEELINEFGGDVTQQQIRDMIEERLTGPLTP